VIDSSDQQRAPHPSAQPGETERAIRTEDGTRIGGLLPIGAWILERPDLIEAMTGWRERNRKMFFTQFPTSAERTRGYLSNAILASSNRLLDLICDEGGEPVGQIGLTNIADRSAELDNLLRGRSGGHPRLIHYAELAFLGWAFSSLDLRTITARFFSYNWMVQELHETVGFGDPVRSPLCKRVDIDLVSHGVCSPEMSNVDYDLIEMRLDRDEFFRLHVFLLAPDAGSSDNRRPNDDRSQQGV
jgi:RimJ/RimL family protein N-acetyltransferase